ncbi:MmpS family transport accessory protein [Nocardia sp. NPDC004860]|uniref:MmpS family transport accessory protein n=1 Tax=Nocardia sp. NPDC004860 TaxID=3154557 RepID=UPI0033A93DA2
MTYQGVPAPGYPMQPPPPKKRKIWPWIVGALLLFIVLPFAACTAVFGKAANDVAKESKRTVDVRYEVTGSGEGTYVKPSITYSIGDTGSGTSTAAQLPWSKDVTLTGILKMATLTATAADDDSATISCRIVQGDKVLVENTATGSLAMATCTTDLSNITGSK